MFLTPCSPRSANLIGSFSPTCSRTDALTQISPGAASVSIRAATLTPSPNMSPSSTMTSPKVDADAEADALGLRPAYVAVFHSLVDHDGAAHGVDYRGELDQHVVAGGLEDTSAVLRDQRIDQLAPIAF